jgi:hypothetical protein
MENFMLKYFLPLGQNEILSVLKLYFKNESKKFPKKLANKFRNFLKYLNQFYFSDSASFSPGFYPYFDLITETGNFSTSTNALESINRQLKKLPEAVFCPFQNPAKFCGTLKVITFYYTKIV